MKFITERTEIAQTINFHKMPVVKMDLANKTEYGLVSEKVNIDNGTFRDGRIQEGSKGSIRSEGRETSPPQTSQEAGQ